MEFPRKNKGRNTLEVKAYGDGYVEIRIRTPEHKHGVEIVLNPEDVDNLCVMLQYFKVERDEEHT